MRLPLSPCLLSIVSLCLLAGCESSAPRPSGAKQDHAAGHHDHAHSSAGPHHGALIELGKDDFHAEWVHDDKQHRVTIYLLDSMAKDAVPIEATSLALNLLVDGKPQPHVLAAQPLATDPAGKSSCFEKIDPTLSAAIDTPGTTGRLNVVIQGKSYVGRLETHDHAHRDK